MISTQTCSVTEQISTGLKVEKYVSNDLILCYGSCISKPLHMVIVIVRIPNEFWSAYLEIKSYNALVFSTFGT